MLITPEHMLILMTVLPKLSRMHRHSLCQVRVPLSVNFDILNLLFKVNEHKVLPNDMEVIKRLRKK